MRKLKPNLKTLFMSGYTAGMLAPQGVLQDMSQFLLKPLKQEDLAERVRVVLSR
ncbi:MAG TPA: hypothetical protein VIS48_10865 [Candidatus Kryptonia bacterium]